MILFSFKKDNITIRFWLFVAIRCLDSWLRNSKEFACLLLEKGRIIRIWKFITFACGFSVTILLFTRIVVQLPILVFKSCTIVWMWKLKFHFLMVSNGQCIALWWHYIFQKIKKKSEMTLCCSYWSLKCWSLCNHPHLYRPSPEIVMFF